MATLNERINDMLARLEAAANQEPFGQPAAPVSQAPRQQTYYPQQAQGFPYFNQFGEPLPPMNEPAPAPEQKTPRQGGQDRKPAQATSVPAQMTALKLTQNSLIEGIIFAEVLGRPVSRRRGRGRHGF
jgi:hypothetical protein